MLCFSHTLYHCRARCGGNSCVWQSGGVFSRSIPAGCHWSPCSDLWSTSCGDTLKGVLWLMQTPTLHHSFYSSWSCTLESTVLKFYSTCILLGELAGRGAEKLTPFHSLKSPSPLAAFSKVEWVQDLNVEHMWSRRSAEIPTQFLRIMPNASVLLAYK